MKHLKPYNEMLKYKLERVVDLRDWDNLVETTYGRPYSFQQQDDCRPRGVYHLTIPDKYADDFENEDVPEIVNGSEMGVSFDAWLTRDPKQPFADGRSDINIWWDRNFYPNVEMVANDLYNRGLIEAGDYTINIDW